MSKQFYGIIPALISPLTESQQIDLEGLDRLITHVLSGKVHGISILGSTGEGPSLLSEQRRQMVNETVRIVNNRCPVITGVAPRSTTDAIIELNEMSKLGVDAALVLPPYYYNLNQTDLYEFFNTAGNQSPIPILLYNIPQLTKVTLMPETVKRLIQNPKIIGIKDSSRDFEYLQNVLFAVADRSDFHIFTGSDTHLLAAFTLGCHGAIVPSSNIFPDWAVGLYEAFKEGNLVKAKEIQRKIVSLVNTCRKGTFPSGWKEATSILGLCKPYMSLPLHQMDHPDATIMQALHTFSITSFNLHNISIQKPV